MVHIVDGALSAPVIAAATALAVGGVAVGLRRLDPERLPQVAVLGAAFFVASLVHVPIGPASAHLLLGGLVGLVLGWAAFPAMLIGLALQALFFGFGGITVLGVNTLDMALPALACYAAFGRVVHSAPPGTTFAWGAAAGALGVALTALMVALMLALSGREFFAAAELVLIAHVPIMVVEGVLTGAVVVLLRRVRPAVFASGRLALARGAAGG